MPNEAEGHRRGRPRVTFNNVGVIPDNSVACGRAAFRDGGDWTRLEDMDSPGRVDGKLNVLRPPVVAFDLLAHLGNEGDRVMRNAGRFLLGCRDLSSPEPGPNLTVEDQFFLFDRELFDDLPSLLRHGEEVGIQACADYPFTGTVATADQDLLYVAGVRVGREHDAAHPSFHHLLNDDREADAADVQAVLQAKTDRPSCEGRSPDFPNIDEERIEIVDEQEAVVQTGK